MSESERSHDAERNRDGARAHPPTGEHLAAWVDDHLEAYLDGELPVEDARRVEAFVRRDEGAARRLAIARRVRNLLSAADRPSCPPEITRAVLEAARKDASAEPVARTASPDRPALPTARTSRDAVPGPSRAFVGLVRRSGRATNRITRRPAHGPATWATYARPALTTAALVLLVVASALFGRSAPDAEPVAERASTPAAAPAPVATPAEVERALQEARWALAYVSSVGRRTGRSIREDVLEERVSEPVQRALETGIGTALGGEPSS